MSNTPFHGKDAKAWWGSTGWTEFDNVTEWTCTVMADTAESHSMHASSYGKTRELGFKSGTAAVTCRLPGDAAIEEGAKYSLELWRTTQSADRGYSGATICTGIDVGVDKDDIETITYSFQFSGTIQSTLSAA